MLRVFILLMLLFPVGSLAADLSKSTISSIETKLLNQSLAKARTFVSANPIHRKSKRTPRAALALWMRIDGIENLLALMREGHLPDDLQNQLKWRLLEHSYLYPMVFYNGDKDVFALAGLVSLHTKAALSELRGKWPADVYRSVKLLASNNGSIIFDRIAPKYAPDLVELDKKNNPPLNWGRPKTK